jgi:hypothetical protein
MQRLTKFHLALNIGSGHKPRILWLFRQGASFKVASGLSSANAALPAVAVAAFVVVMQ